MKMIIMKTTKNQKKNHCRLKTKRKNQKDFSIFWNKKSKNKNPVIISDNDSPYEQDQDIDLPTFLRNQKKTKRLRKIWQI